MAGLRDGVTEAYTFDDVLLKPGLSEIMPSEANIRTHITRAIALNIPIIASAMDTVTEARMAIAMAQAGGLGVIHRNFDIDGQAAQVRQVKKFESGMVRQSADDFSGCEARRRADADEGERHLRRSGGHRRRSGKAGQAGRHSDQSRRALRHRSGPEGLGTDDAREPRHRARKRRPGRSQAAAASASHRKASGRRRRLSLRRADHGQGHREGRGASARLQGRAGPLARRRRHHGRRGRFRAHREADRCRRGHHRGRYRARPFPARA